VAFFSPVQTKKNHRGRWFCVDVPPPSRAAFSA
jgi:hypothetical protein